MAIELHQETNISKPATHGITTAQFKAMPIDLMERTQFGRIAHEFYKLAMSGLIWD